MQILVVQKPGERTADKVLVLNTTDGDLILSILYSFGKSSQRKEPRESSK